MNKRHVLPILLVAIGFLAAGPEAPAELIPGTSNSLPQLVTSHGTFKLGKKPYPKGTREQWIAEGRVLARAPEGYLPRDKALKGAADNRIYLPPIGNQSSEGSCVHWAGSYYTKTANMKRNNPAIVLTAASNQCSPRFTYNLSNAGADNGGYGHEPFEIFMRYGGASLQQKPYVAGQYTTLPTVADFVEGLHRRTTNYVWVWEWDPSTAQINELKAFLDAGGVAVCGVYAEDSFDAWGPGDAPWVGTACTIDNINHMVTVFGYGTGYYLVANQWGTSFGSNGFIVVNSSYFENYFSDVMYPLEGATTPATSYAKIQIQHPQRSDIRSLSFSVNGATVWSNSPLPKNLPKGTGSFDTDTRDNWQLAVDLSSASWGAANTVTARCMDQVAANSGSLTNFTLRHGGTDYVSTDTPVAIPNNTGAAAVARVSTAPAETRIIGLSGNLAFGGVTTGQTATATMTIANSGTLTLTVSSISYPSGFSGAWSGTIAAGGSHAVTVTFAPTAVQSYGGTVTVNSDKTSGANTLAASGTGIGASTLTISPAATNVPAAASSGRQIVVTANVAWTAATNASWLTIAAGGAGGASGTITYGVAANSLTAGRTGAVLVAGGGMVRTCTVVQAGAAAALTIDPAATNVPAAASSGRTIALTANVAWTASTNAPWLSIAGGAAGSGNGTVTYNVAANGNLSGRTGAVLVAGGGMVRTCTVAQIGLAPAMTISPISTNVPADASGGRFIAVTANMAWTASTNAPWLSIAGGAAGSGNGTVAYGVAANGGTAGRTGAILVAGSGIVRTCTVAQAGAPAPSTYYRDADGDGYGNPNISTTSGVPPFGYVGDNTDCDDANWGVHPGAAEVCDGTDNDCDGQTDEGCAASRTYFSLDQWVACAGSGWSRTSVMDLKNYSTLAVRDGYQSYEVYYPLHYNIWTGIYVYDYDSGSFRAVTWMLNLNL